jgi:carboxypeptidase family protein
VPIVSAIAIVGLLIAAGVTWMNRPHRRHAGSGDGSATGSGSGGSAAAAAIGGVRLTGIVVDGTGAPVIGAEVSAELEQGAVDRSLAGTGSGSGVTGGGGKPVRAPATGKDGRFVVQGLVAGRYRLRVSGPGLVPAEVRYVPVPSDEARIVVARQVSVDGKVVDGGVAAPNAMVGLRGEAIGGVLEQKVDAKGEFHFANLPEGRYQVYAWQAALAARAVRVNRLGAGPFTPVELRLEAATIVVGRVVDREEGVGLIAAVELRPSGDDQAPRYARSGDDGVFRIEGVPNGTWIADAFAPGYASSGGVELQAGRGVPELALTRGGTIEGQILDGEGKPIEGAAVRALVGGAGAGGDASATDAGAVEQSAAVDQDKLRRFSGRIAAAAAAATGAATVAAANGGDPDLLPRGELGVTVGPIPPIPPAGAQVARPASIDTSAAGGNVLVGEPPPLAATDPARASIWVTGPDGRYRIRGAPRGKATVLALASGYAEGRSKQVTIELGQTITKIDIVLTVGTMIAGRVLDGRGAPVAGAQVSVVPDVGGGRLDAFTDGEGKYRIGPVSGAVELSATAYGHGVARKKLELAAGRGSVPAERQEDLVLAVADAMLAGTLDDATGAPVAGGTLEIVGGAGEGRRAVTGADGTFSLDMLPSGPVRLRIVHPDYPPAEVDAVAATGTPARVRLRLPLGGAVEGVLLDAYSGAGLAGIAVSGEGPGGSTTDATTDKDGRWRLGPLAPGHWRVTVAQPGYRPLARELDVPAARAPGVTSVRDVRLDLARGAMVGGTVRDGRGQRIANATVTVQAVDGGSSGGAAEGITDAAGEFRIRDCPTGELSIGASRGTERGTIRVTIRPGDEVLGLAIEIR